MKKVFSGVFVVMALFLVSCGPTVDQAIEHNDAIVADQKEVLNFREEVADLVFDMAEPSEINKKFDEYSSYLATMVDKYEKMPAFDKTDVFRTAMIDFLKSYKGVCDNQFKTFVKLYQTPPSEEAPELEEQIDALAGEIDELENKSLQIFIQQQEVFSNEYGFKLVE